MYSKDLHPEALLIDFLQRNQGAALNNLNVGRANNATTYRQEFCDASADLYKLYRINGIQKPLDRMLTKFLENKIETCRSNEFDKQKIAYFYENFIAYRLRGHKFIILDQLLLEHRHNARAKSCS
jgi:hypothetical protein